jgi:LmbE family N-acetylglucosaminyl deacetylase
MSLQIPSGETSHRPKRLNGRIAMKQREFFLERSCSTNGLSLATHRTKAENSLTSRNSSFLLSNLEALPFREVATVARKRVVIVAPHPDDETLGCGGAIALLCRHNYDVRVLVMSDGTLSHPNSRKYPAPALQSLREQETINALSILGVNRKAVTFFRFKDGSVPSLTCFDFQNAKVLCRNYLQAVIPETIFIPWRADPHSDHRATWQLIRTALLDSEMKIKCIEYPIWDWDVQQQRQVSSRDRILGWRLDISPVLHLKTQAIAAYKSQLGQIIDDDPSGFCLTTELLTNFKRPWEVYFEETL